MEVAAFVISVLAFIAAGLAAVYTASYARTAKRGVRLESEAHPVLELTHAAAISGAGRPRVGGAPLIGVRNVGKTIALSLSVIDLNGNVHTVGKVKPDQLALTGIAPDATQEYVVAWMTIDQQHRRRKMRLMP